MYYVQAYCTGMGWVNWKTNPYESWAAAHDAELSLRANDAAWCATDTLRQTRIISRGDKVPGFVREATGAGRPQ